MNKPISLDKARRELKKKNNGAPPPPANTDDLPCPITALGHADGKFWFLNIEGERRSLSARQLGMRAEIAALFLGDMTWLQQRFKSFTPEGTPNGFKVSQASEFLMNACRVQGIFGDHIRVRGPGVWAGDGAPIAHCGDAVFVDGEQHPAGVRLAGQIFAAAARQPHPAGAAAPAFVARGIAEDMRKLWLFRDDGGEMIALGLVGQGYLAASLAWRANGFISGASNAGKSQLLELLRAMVPVSHYSTDTTKAGIESAVNGRAVVCFIDESSDRSDGTGGQTLIDVVLSSSSGSGTKGHRGTADGGVRTIEMVGSVIMASVTPPSMQPQHRSRFSMIELLKPEKGADNLAAMRAAQARAAAAGPALFARALAGFDRYQTALKEFRHALSKAGCIPREMDQLGAVLAGYWILTEDDVPDEFASYGVVEIIKPFIRGADEMAADDAPQIVLHKLLSHVVSLDRSTDTDSIARVIKNAMYDGIGMYDDDKRDSAKRVLDRWGIRVVRASDLDDGKGRAVPRMGSGNGLWIDRRVEPLRKIFAGTAYEGDRWVFELNRLPSARVSKSNVRVGSLPPGKAIWISWDQINGDLDTG